MQGCVAPACRLPCIMPYEAITICARKAIKDFLCAVGTVLRRSLVLILGAFIVTSQHTFASLCAAIHSMVLCCHLSRKQEWLHLWFQLIFQSIP